MIDWSKFDKYERSEVTCYCGAVFYSHAKFDLPKGRVVTRTACPKCGKDDDVRRASSPPERDTIGPAG